MKNEIAMSEHKITGNAVDGYRVAPVNPEHGRGVGYPSAVYPTRDAAERALAAYVDADI